MLHRALVPVLALLVLVPSLQAATTPAPASGAGLEDTLAFAAGVDAADFPARTESLVALVQRADARFDVLRAPEAYAALDALDPRLAGVTADLLHALLLGAAERDAAYARVTDAELRALRDDEGSPAALEVAGRVDAERLRRAAVAVARAVDAARPALEALAAERALANAPAPLARALPPPMAPPIVDLFPVIGIDPLGVPNTFPHDYFLSIDLGGDDVYDNNAGGSIIVRGFKLGDPSTFGPTVAGLTIGGEFEDSGEAYSATLAIDVAGNDVYGVYKAPSTVGGSRDRFCTSGTLIRRVVVQGSGSGGFGILADLSGDDRYRAKTLAQGHGHIAGVGLLFDANGNDRYTAIRAMQGSAVVQGVGALADLAGDDVYESVSPPGGIWNVDRGRCDATLRLSLGSAVAQGAAVFVDASGDDAYRVDSQALGHGEGMGYALFLDGAGADDYGGYAGRVDGARLHAATPFATWAFVDAQ